MEDVKKSANCAGDAPLSPPGPGGESRRKTTEGETLPQPGPGGESRRKTTEGETLPQPGPDASTTPDLSVNAPTTPDLSVNAPTTPDLSVNASTTPDLSVTLAGVTLKNPVIPASGTFGYGREYAELFDLNILGAFSWKGTTAQARDGNPPPRIAETPSGMLNAIGLQNPGIDAVLRDEVPRIARIFDGPVIANVGGFSVEEYAENCRKLDAVEQCAILEINISCPNVHAGGKNFGTDAKAAAAVTAAVRRVTRKPIFMKLTPNVSDITEIARACADSGADGLCLINTLLGMRIDLKTRRPVLANRTGGLSGPAVFPVALRMVWDVYDAVRLPIIGCGGVSSASDVAEMMLAGAAAVEIGAAGLRDPFVYPRIIAELPDICGRLGVDKISGLTGAAHS